MNSIAIITPWPSQRTGIADYAYDLVLGLASHELNIDVFTDCPEELRTRVPFGATNVTVQNIHRFTRSSDYDQVIYQMGNNSSFHAEMLAILFDNPGVVHLHDPTLHHLLAFLLFRPKSTLEYYRVLNYWYGFEKYKEVRNWISQGKGGFWDSERVSEVPFFEPVLQHATSCIVHSQFARERVLERMPNLKVTVIPQQYRNMKCVTPHRSPDSRKLQIGVFGIVQKHKHIDLVVRALRELNESYGSSESDSPDFHLHVCGEMEAGCRELPKLVAECGLAKRVSFHGHQPESEFLRSLKNIDICVALRYPTLGETSAIVSRTLQLGVPTIVNNVGWYAELPDCVIKLPTGAELQPSLQRVLGSFLESPWAYEKWRADCVTTSTELFSFDKMIENYIHAINLESNYSKPILPFELCKDPIAAAN